MAYFPRGSEWRKWDLHVHTPASFHWNGGKRLSQMNPEEKTEAFKIMLDTINESDVAIFAIMDYWTFDGYNEFLKTIQENSWQLNKTVLPGMELRIESPTNYRLNIHVILSDKLSLQQLLDFKSSLRLRLVERMLSEEALTTLSGYLGNDKKREKGFDPDRMNDNDRLMFGSMVAEVTKDSFESALNSIPPNCGFVLLPYDTSDGLSKLDWKSFPLSDTYFLRMADIFETRKQSTIDLFLGEKTNENIAFIDDFQAALDNKPKPGISGSDAHKFSDYGVYPNNKITWIKADPTFEGLKQIIYEPETRVCISENKPDDKLAFYIIDKVKFIDNRMEKDFSSEWIELNPNLNVIIGGKSSGKSLLLHYIAKTIDEIQVREKSNVKYEFEDDPNFDFEVSWCDGTVDRLQDKEINKITKHQITYLPQMYINQLADSEGHSNLKQLILNILLQNIPFNDYYSTQVEQIKEKKLEIESNVLSLFSLKEEVELIREKLSSLGDKEGISLVSKNLLAEIEDIRKKSGFTADEETDFLSLTKNYEYHDDEIRRLEYVQKLMNEYEKFSKQLALTFMLTLKGNSEELTAQLEQNQKNASYIDAVNMKLINISATMDDHVDFNEINSQLENELQANIARKNDFNTALLPYKIKFDNQNRISELQKNLEQTKNLLLSISEHESHFKVAREKYYKKIELIISKYNDLLINYKEVERELINEEYKNISADMRLESRLSFDHQQFKLFFTEAFNRQKRLYKILPECFDENDDFICGDLNTHVEKIGELLKETLDNKELRLKSSFELKNVVLALLADYFTLEFDLIQKNDHIMHMSPGKRGLVLLQLFLHLSNTTHPILIDQPEDNLDNRTIYTELNSFIKDKKIDRQIIIVTHNANLVVLTDAEQVIVANQAGQQIERDNRQYRFEYVTGALEFSFEDESKNGILYKIGIKEHVCEILEGGREAFEKREQKYGF